MKRRAILVLALLLLASGCRETPDPRPAALKQELAKIRAAIQRHRADTGSYPASLQALVPKYLPSIPNDPITNAQSWRVITEESVQPSSDFQTAPSEATAPVVIDVQSGAPGADSSGTPYSNY